jgi:predicted dehydrogenase
MPTQSRGHGTQALAQFWEKAMHSMTRRSFLGAGAAACLTAAVQTGADREPNERIRLAVMGVHGRGKQLAAGFAKQEHCEVAYVCDADDAVLGLCVKAVGERQQKAPKVEKDIRRLLEAKDFDALVVATPDHWHALATVWACQHGKHVYVEKPISHNVVEGRRMVQAARKYNRVVQYGCQRRSAEHFREACEFVRSGQLGKVPFARAWIAGNRPNIGKKADAPTPAGVDYDLWLGPAPLRAFNPNRFHYTWHWFWDYGTGELGNNGIHALDICRWGLGVDYPTRVTCGGGKHFYDDDQETPDTQVATFDFPPPLEKGEPGGVSITWEHRVWSKTGLMGEPWGVAFYGSKGTLVFDKNGWHVEDGITASGKPSGDLDAAHLRNFLDAIRGDTKPNADIEEGHKTTLLCHLGNIAYRLGRTLTGMDPTTERFGSDPEANQLLGRSYRRGFSLPEIS